MTMHSLVRTSAVLLVAGTLLLPALWAADVPAVQDTYISSATPGTNFGIAATLNIAPGSAGLVQFDLSSIPPSSTVPVAYLRVYVNKVTTVGSLDFLAGDGRLGRKHRDLPRTCHCCFVCHHAGEHGQFFPVGGRHRSGERLAGQPGHQFRDLDRGHGRNYGFPRYQRKYRHKPPGSTGSNRDWTCRTCWCDRTSGTCGTNRACRPCRTDRTQRAYRPVRRRGSCRANRPDRSGGCCRRSRSQRSAGANRPQWSDRTHGTNRICWRRWSGWTHRIHRAEWRHRPNRPDRTPGIAGVGRRCRTTRPNRAAGSQRTN